MTIENAAKLFQTGKFSEAEKLYSEIIKKDSKDFMSLVQLGEIALYSNQFVAAEKWLKEAIALKPEEQKPKMLLKEAYYRQDDYQKVASLLQQAGKKEAAVRFESFGKSSPYHIKSDKTVTKIKFLKTDPLPIIQLTINGSEPVNFFIDTGAAETVIDTEYAKELDVEIFDSQTGIFAGGMKAPIQFGKITSITLGNFTIENIPVSVLPVRHFSDLVFGGTKVDGIIGTTLFYHFLTTMDYINDELILQRKTEQNFLQLEKSIKAQNSIVIPFWMAGDHYIVAWGRVNNSKPLLFFVDTGLAGGGFTCSQSTLEETTIELEKENESTGIGGGGTSQIIPFIVDELSLGDAKEKNIRGVYSPGANLDSMLGFHLGGIISHGFFRNYALTFDFKEMRLVLNRFSTK